MKLLTQITNNTSTLLVYQGFLSETPLQSILADTGAEGDFISTELVERLKLTRHSCHKGQVEMPDGRTYPSHKIEAVPITICGYTELLDLYEAPIKHDIILGMPWHRRHNPVTFDFEKKTLSFNNTGTQITLTQSTTQDKMHVSSIPNVVEEISAKQLNKHCKEKDSHMFVCNVVHTTTKESLTETLNQLEEKHGFQLVNMLSEYKTIFEGTKGLPPSRQTDHEIQLTPDASPPFRPLYPLSPLELDLMKKEIEKLLKLGHIQASTSPFGAPVFFVKQKDKFRMVIDYRALNKITVKNRCALPNMTQLVSRLSDARVFSKIDLQSGFHQIRIIPEDTHKTAFRTKYGHFEFKVLPFGLCNSPATFQQTMNHIFRPLIDKCLVVYMDDILVYSRSKEEHMEHLLEVLDTMKKNELIANLSKCKFFAEEVEYLGLKIKYKEISPDPSRISAIQDWITPTTVHGLRQFLGLTNTLLRFVPGYAQVAAPLSD